VTTRNPRRSHRPGLSSPGAQTTNARFEALVRGTRAESKSQIERRHLEDVAYYLGILGKPFPQWRIKEWEQAARMLTRALESANRAQIELRRQITKDIPHTIRGLKQRIVLIENRARGPQARAAIAKAKYGKVDQAIASVLRRNPQAKNKAIAREIETDSVALSYDQILRRVKTVAKKRREAARK